MVAVTVVGAVVLVASLILAFSLGTHHPATATTSSSTGTASVPAATPPAPVHRPHSSRSATPTTPSTPTSPSTSTPPASGPAAVLSSLSPAAGGAGQQVVVSGSNFMSPDGQDRGAVRWPGGTDQAAGRNVVHGHRAYRTSPRAVSMTVTTQGGTSNALPFQYN